MTPKILFQSQVAHLGRGSTVLENAELVALRIGQNHPRNVALSNVNTRRSEREKSPNLGGLIVRTKIDMETVLALLRFVDGQEQDPWKPIWLWLNLKDGWSIVDDDPSERFAPPPAQRGGVRCGDHDLLPFKAHGRKLAKTSRGCTTGQHQAQANEPTRGSIIDQPIITPSKRRGTARARHVGARYLYGASASPRGFSKTRTWGACQLPRSRSVTSHW